MKKVKRLNIDKIPKRLNIDKIKEKTSRTSLTIGLSVFVFVIIFVAIALTALGLWILTVAGVTVDMYGELQLGLVILFMTIISLVIGFLIAFSSSHLPLKPVNELILLAPLLILTKTRKYEYQTDIAVCFSFFYQLKST